MGGTVRNVRLGQLAVLSCAIFHGCNVAEVKAPSLSHEETDTTAPLLSGIAATSITATSALIIWTTDEAADSIVEYGKTTGYGGSTPLYGLTTTHTATLSALTPVTLYHFRVKSRDAAGNLATSSDLVFTTATVSSDTVPPTVALSSPTPGTAVAGTVAVSATASDNVGVAGVQFLLDGSPLGAEDTVAPYSIAWDSTQASNGSHSLSARARDAAGNQTTSAAVGVTVQQDITPPVMSNGAPSAALPAGTTQTTMSVTTNEAATCKWATSNVAYGSMTNTFTTTGGTSHSTTLNNLANGQSYTRYVRCQDTAGNANGTSYSVSFSVANAADTTAPSTPSGLSSSVSSCSEIDLSWNPSTDTGGSGLRGYRIYRGGVFQVEITATSASDSGLAASTSYSYAVSAIDNAGNESLRSATVTASTSACGALPVFPGAEGYGTTTSAGRGGQVIRVTNLNDSGPGSLRAALSTTGSRTIVFDVSGQINLQSTLCIGIPLTNDCDPSDAYGHVTVAGQTAPSPGITLAVSGPSGTGNNGLYIRAGDVLLQHLRMRGDVTTAGGARRDVLFIDHSNVVVDHVSVSWGGNGGKNMLTGGGVQDVTISNSIDAEASPYGLLIQEYTQRISIIRSLFAHNFDRNPETKGGAHDLFLNNLIYNPGGPGRWPYGIWANPVNEPPQEGPNLTSLIGNVPKPGPSSDPNLTVLFKDSLVSGSQAYLSDNAFLSPPVFESTTTVQVSAPPFPLPSPLTILSSNQVETYVRAHAGARPANRDAVDARIVADATNGTMNGQKGIFPALTSNTRALTLPANPSSDDDGDGYSNIEELLHALAACVEGTSGDTAQCRSWAVVP